MPRTHIRSAKARTAREKATLAARKEIIRRLKANHAPRDIAESLGYSTMRVYQIKKELAGVKS